MTGTSPRYNLQAENIFIYLHGFTPNRHPMQPISSFKDLTSHLAEANCRKKLAVANAVDSHTLDAVLMAVEAGIVEAYLVGDVAAIESPELFEKPSILPFIHIIDKPEVVEATLEAVRMVKEGEADILMKGLVNTDVILRAILDKEKGLLPPGNVLTYNAALEIPGYHKLLFFSDAAVIPRPTLEQYRSMIANDLALCRTLGCEEPRVALIHCTEKINEKFPHTLSYVELKKEAQEGRFGKVFIDGPMDAKTACDKHSGEIKGLSSPVVGNADILIFPNIESGNTFYKTLSLFGDANMAGMLTGTIAPVVVPSRSDSGNSKYYSLVLACLAGTRKE